MVKMIYIYIYFNECNIKNEIINESFQIEQNIMEKTTKANEEGIVSLKQTFKTTPKCALVHFRFN